MIQGGRGVSLIVCMEPPAQRKLKNKNDMNGKIGVTTENIFPVIKQFLYSDHEIFLRELVANAVDATEKMKALASSGEFKGELGQLDVRIELDEKKKILRVIDRGIGMTEEIGRAHV